MELLLLSLVTCFLLFILVKSAELVEEAFVFLARKIHISEFFIGFVVLSIITSLPEMSIAILSSQDIPELSIGNLIGATTVLLTLVIGLSAVKYGNLKFKGKFAEPELIMGVGIIALMVVVIFDRVVSVAEGVILLVTYIGYIGYLNRKFNRNLLKKHSTINLKRISKLVLKASIGVLMLLVSSTFIVKSATQLAYLLEISPAIVGLLLLAVGTNLPEIAILTISKRRKDEEDLALGNFFGSAVVNPGILGLLAVLAGGIEISSFISLIPSITILILTIVLFSVAAWTGKVISRFEGILLTSLYFALIIAEVLILLQ